MEIRKPWLTAWREQKRMRKRMRRRRERERDCVGGHILVMFYPPRDPHTRQVVWEIEYFFFALLGSRATELQGGNRGVLRTSTQRERYTYGLAVWPYKELLTHARLTRLMHYNDLRKTLWVTQRCCKKSWNNLNTLQSSSHRRENGTKGENSGKRPPQTSNLAKMEATDFFCLAVKINARGGRKTEKLIIVP